jgi:hypothetical protein
MDAVSTTARTLAAGVALALAALAGGCAEYKAENRPLAEFPGVQQQIQQYYDANATENDWACPEVDMDGIDKTKVVRQSATQVRMAVTYYFVSDDDSARRSGDECQGFNTRFFTFDKGPGGQLSLVSMTGPQRGGGA